MGFELTTSNIVCRLAAVWQNLLYLISFINSKGLARGRYIQPISMLGKGWRSAVLLTQHVHTKTSLHSNLHWHRQLLCETPYKQTPLILDKSLQKYKDLNRKNFAFFGHILTLHTYRKSQGNEKKDQNWFNDQKMIILLLLWRLKNLCSPHPQNVLQWFLKIPYSSS